ncbi:MAG: amidohydrolase family protein [Phycisphaeraceae bacterium]|nr:amidohydrolase family protein [Phycisphaerae bacterium]MBX3393605.1 amidohydrolase family protein [Phycisphaeraceae bacterium]HRJ49228.1 amidohydrolase family protein [Phycisphaerales bacterium]
MPSVESSSAESHRPGVVRDANNLIGLDYRAEAAKFAPRPRPIIDIHTHILGSQAPRVYLDVAAAYGVGMTYSQTPLPGVDEVRDAMGDRVGFIACPNWSSPDRSRAFREGYLADMEVFRSRHGARMMKIWNAPRLRDFFPGQEGADLVTIDGAWRVKQLEAARDLGMAVMVHVADPDTWFATRYAEAAKYGAKRDHYIGLEKMLDRFGMPWLAAHMGGWPEDLDFLAGLLTRHPNLHLDCSATRWIVREISKHPREVFTAFMERWRGRILFGSDIVTADDHVRPEKKTPGHPKSDQASSPSSAFDLYASRYWALRTMLESDYDGPSPIADTDLMMVRPGEHDEWSSPRLRGFCLSPGVLDDLYRGAAERFWGTLT